MDDQTRSANQQSAVVDAANQLLPALAELDRLQDRQVDLQRKATRLSGQILTLARAQSRGWSDSRQTELIRLESNANALQLKIDATQRSMGRVRRRFEAALARFRTIFVAQDVQLSDFQIGNSDLLRQNAALDRIVRHLIRRMAAGLPENPHADGFQVPEESYDYIAIGIPYFLDALTRMDRILSLDPNYSHETLRYRPVSFLEIGSASGRNMMMAQSSEILLCKGVHGFDINPDQVANGATLFGLGDALEVADAMTFDYEGYDILFSYRPFSDTSMQAKLEQAMVEGMSDGAYVIAPFFHDLARYPALQAADRRGDIWKKS